MVAARDEDLIAGMGLSYVSLEQVRHAVAGTDIVCVQNLFHLADRRAAPLLEECLSRCIAFVPFCPLRWPRCLPENLAEAASGPGSSDEELRGGFHLRGTERRPVRRLPVRSWSVQLVESWVRK